MKIVDEWLYRGGLQSDLGLVGEAIKSFSRVLELQPKNAEAYQRRGRELGIFGHLERAERVLDYIHRVWRRPVRLRTVDAEDKEWTVSKE